ncbi:MAG: hypothetical protein ABSF35_07615 [Polyangia bacterium]|jgi:hypothetical protein
MLRVAIATENQDYDGEIYRFLLQGLLGVEIERWAPTEPVLFNGWVSVLRQARTYLKLAQRDGIGHALIAIDNDGGRKRHPEHEDSHKVAEQAADKKGGCRVCLLSHALSQTWIAGEGMKCIVVPVQMMETWLLTVRGFVFKEATPEERFCRPVLKRDFFGESARTTPQKTQMALAVLRLPDALNILRRRPSFQHFERQLAGWK